MRLVIQRVKSCSVSVQENIVGSINSGLYVLVGLQQADSFETSCKPLLEKLFKLKLFDNEAENKRWSMTLKDADTLSLMLVSQFTLMANTNKGAKPDFHAAMSGELAKPLFEKIVNYSKEVLGEGKVSCGSFGNYMKIDAVLDGPTTIILDSDN